MLSGTGARRIWLISSAKGICVRRLAQELGVAIKIVDQLGRIGCDRLMWWNDEEAWNRLCQCPSTALDDLELILVIFQMAQLHCFEEMIEMAAVRWSWVVSGRLVLGAPQNRIGSYAEGTACIRASLHHTIEEKLAMVFQETSWVKIGIKDM